MKTKRKKKLQNKQNFHIPKTQNSQKKPKPKKKKKTKPRIYRTAKKKIVSKTQNPKC